MANQANKVRQNISFGVQKLPYGNTNVKTFYNIKYSLVRYFCVVNAHM